MHDKCCSNSRGRLRVLTQLTRKRVKTPQHDDLGIRAAAAAAAYYVGPPCPIRENVSGKLPCSCISGGVGTGRRPCVGDTSGKYIKSRAPDLSVSVYNRSSFNDNNYNTNIQTVSSSSRKTRFSNARFRFPNGHFIFV